MFDQVVDITSFTFILSRREDWPADIEQPQLQEKTFFRDMALETQSYDEEEWKWRELRCDITITIAAFRLCVGCEKSHRICKKKKWLSSYADIATSNNF